MFLHSIKRRDQCKKYLERNFEVRILTNYKKDLQTMKDSSGKMFNFISLYKLINLSSLMNFFSSLRVADLI